jgi:hypothetical protein
VHVVISNDLSRAGIEVVFGSGTSDVCCADSGRWILGMSDTSEREMVFVVTSNDFGRAGAGVGVMFRS